MGHKKDRYQRDNFQRNNHRRKFDEDDIASAVVFQVLARLENPNDPLGQKIRAWLEKALDFVLGLLGGRSAGRTAPREDPAALLRQAQQDMGQAQAVNHARAAEVRAQRDELQALVAQTQRAVDDLQARAEGALRSGNRALAHELLTEKQNYMANLARMQDLLQATTESMQAVEAALRREEDRIRVKTAEALAMKAQWNQSQIELSLDKALNSVSARDTNQGFERAQSQVSQARNESAARRELAEEDLDRRTARLAAAAELSALEQRLSALPASPEHAANSRPFASPSDLDQQLQALEARIGRRQE